jgi:glycosyltransferase involved in cell wall biosynthesis
MHLYVDHTHLGRPITGLERITLELFSPEALAPLRLVPVTAHGTAQMVAVQTLGLPARLAASWSAILLCPGFPPSPLLLPFADRVIPYVHDVFLLTRADDLNLRAKLYMVEPFRLAVHRCPRFFVNSEDTRQKLSRFCRPDADVILYRPHVRNVFGLEWESRPNRSECPNPLRLVALGTVEPRKNLIAAADLMTALRARMGRTVTLDIIGRRGWGSDWEVLEAVPGVHLHGYLPGTEARAIIGQADAFISTSHEEGCGIPLLEAQYAGLPVIAPDDAVFHEVLGSSGIFIDPADPAAGAELLAAAFERPGWRFAYVTAAKLNLARWNRLAADDREVVIDCIGQVARTMNGRYAH